MLRWTGTPWVLPIAVPMSADQLMDLIVEYVDAFRERECQLALSATGVHRADVYDSREH